MPRCILCRKENEDDTQTDVEEVAIAVSSKEAYEGFKAFSKYIEQSTTYDEQKLELLQKCEDCIFEVKQEQMKQTKIASNCCNCFLTKFV